MCVVCRRLKVSVNHDFLQLHKAFILSVKTQANTVNMRRFNLRNAVFFFFLARKCLRIEALCLFVTQRHVIYNTRVCSLYHLVPCYPFTSDSLPIAQPVHKHAIVIAGWPCDSVWPAGLERGGTQPLRSGALNKSVITKKHQAYSDLNPPPPHSLPPIPTL